MSRQALLFLVALPLAAAPIPKADHPVAVLGDTSPGEKENENVWFLESHAKLLKSREVLEATLHKPGVADLLPPLKLGDDHVAWVQQRLKVEIEPEKHTFKVWMTGLGPRDQAHLLNIILDVFMAEVARQQRKPWERGIKSEEESLKRDRWLLAIAQSRFRGSGDPRDAREVQSLQETIELTERCIEQDRAKLREPLRLTVLQKPQENP